MNLREYFQDEAKLNESYNFYISKKLLFKEENTVNLVSAHINKAEHNIKLLKYLDDEFNDWKIVGLYYALYHSCLALVSNKKFVSKNHTATLLFLIKHYSEIGCEELELIENLQIKEKDAILYTDLKQKRQNASYSTSLMFDSEMIKDYSDKTVSFLNKVKEIVEYLV